MCVCAHTCVCVCACVCALGYLPQELTRVAKRFSLERLKKSDAAVHGQALLLAVCTDETPYGAKELVGESV